jgi:hypothetical protein
MKYYTKCKINEKLIQLQNYLEYKEEKKKK